MTATSDLLSIDADIHARDRADRLARALTRYAASRHSALLATQAFDLSGDEAHRRSAEGFRADARADLHPFPDLLKMVEPS